MTKTFRTILILFLFTINLVPAFAQDSIKSKALDYFIEPEMMMGKIVPTRMPFPYSSVVTSCFLNVGFIDKTKEKYWASYYNYPSTGISFAFTNLGNESVFGNIISIAPYIQFKWARHKLNTSYFKFGIGSSYFTKLFNKESNPSNIMIGSHFTWTFQAFCYRYLYHGKNMNLKAGIGYLHNSNGHIQLPNNGLNAGMISLAAQVFTDKSIVHNYYPDEHLPIDHAKQYFFQIRAGAGVQEFGGRNGPDGSPKKGVYTTSISGGIIFNQQIKVRCGLAYRFYQHYYEYITQHPDTNFNAYPRNNASNAFIFLGFEFLVGHFALDVEEGINLYKPFYPTFFKKFESGPAADLFLKKWVTSRMGLDYYLINTKLKPKSNLFIGAYINANFGQADFSEITLGYTHIF